MSLSLAVLSSNRRQTFLTCAFTILIMCFYCVASNGAEKSQPPPQAGDSLICGVPFRRELAGGQKHIWRMTLATGEYVQLVIEPMDIDVVVSLTDPAGRQVWKSALPNVGYGERQASVNSWIAERSGAYVMEIRPQQPAAEQGSYEVKIEELRPALEADGLRIEAHRLWTEGAELWTQNATEARRKALQKYVEALSILQKLRDRAGEAATLIHLGRLQAKMGNLVEARNLFERGIKLSESLRGRLVGQELRSSYLATLQNRYELYIDLLMELDRKEPGAGHAAAALQTSECTRARSLLELLAETNADIRRGADPSLLAKERELQQRLNAKAAVQTKLLSGKHSKEEAVALAGEISDLMNQLSDATARIRASSPGYAALTQPEPLNLKEIQGQLDENTVLLEFALGTNRSWMWIVTPRETASFELPPRSKIEAAARKYYGLLTARQPNEQESSIQYAARVAEADAKYRTEASVISRMLLSPIAGRLNLEWKGKRLVIVASGALDYLPFAALPVPTADGKAIGGYRPLIVDHEIVNLPSASVLAALRRESAGRPRAAKSLAILADPVFEANDPRVLMAAKKKESTGKTDSRVKSNDSSSIASTINRGLARSVSSFHRSGFSQLPFSRIEAEAISALIPQSGLLKATGFRANRAMATSGELAHYRIVHFATHGLLNSKHPQLSGLVLSLVDENGKAQDGFLRMHEIYNLQLPADLVVLSACQTAVGKEIKGEGLIGLTRGFMYAGAERVVAGLWQVDDQATSELMKRFYRGMLTRKLRPAAALRAAQIEMMNHKRLSTPYYWAGFSMQGEWR